MTMRRILASIPGALAAAALAPTAATAQTPATAHTAATAQPPATAWPPGIENRLYEIGVRISNVVLDRDTLRKLKYGESSPEPAAK